MRWRRSRDRRHCGTQNACRATTHWRTVPIRQVLTSPGRCCLASSPNLTVPTSTTRTCTCCFTLTPLSTGTELSGQFGITIVFVVGQETKPVSPDSADADRLCSDPDSTGAIAVFAFVLSPRGTAAECHVWVCRSAAEEDLFEQRLGPLEPGRWTVWSGEYLPEVSITPAPATPCRLAAEDIPEAWLSSFPTGAEIVAKAVEMRPEPGQSPDNRLLRRRDCEYDIFLSVEEVVEMPRYPTGIRQYRRVRVSCPEHSSAPEGTCGPVPRTSSEGSVRRGGFARERGLRTRRGVRAGTSSGLSVFPLRPATATPPSPPIYSACWPSRQPAEIAGDRFSMKLAESIRSTCSRSRKAYRKRSSAR